MTYIPLSKQKSVSTPENNPIQPTGGYVPLSQANGGGYVPLSQVKPDTKPPVDPFAPVVATPAPAPQKQGFFSKVGQKVADAIDRPENKGQAGTTMMSQLPSSIVESLPFGIGTMFKTIHDMEQGGQGTDMQYFDNKDMIKALPGAVVDTAKGFVKAPISGALNVAGLVTGKKIKFNIPGLGEVNNATYRVAERVQNGDNPVVVALEEGSSAILDTLFFASLASKPFVGRPITTAKSEMPADFYAKQPNAVKGLQPKSFRLYEPKTTAQVLSPRFIETAKSQGVDFGVNFKAERPTYFKMSFDPKGNVFKGEIVQVRPSWVSIIAKKFGGDIMKAPPQALEVISTPKEVKVKDIENAVKNPIIEEKMPETTNTPLPPETPPTAPLDNAQKLLETPPVEDPRVNTLLGVEPAKNEFNPKNVENLHTELKTAYQKYPEAQQKLTEILASLDLAEAGKRIFDYSGVGTEVKGVSSTFPAWIPEGLRTKKSLDKLTEIIKDIDSISYPSRSNSHNQRLLVNEMLSVLDSRLGVDTSGIRGDILKEYGKNQSIDNKNTGGSKPAGRGEATPERAKIEEAKNTEKQDRIARLEDEIKTRQDFSGELSDDQIFKTPSGNAMAIYKDASTPEIPITPGKLINDINPIEFPELVDIARDLMGKVPSIVKKTGNASGRFYADPNNPRIKLVAELFNGENPRQMAVVLAHEIGHLIDFLPNQTLTRGNLLGRLMTLRKFMKNTFGEAENVTNKEIRAELLKVTQELHPYNPEKVPASYKRYRESAVELYAEAVSMLFNNPGHLQEIAPKFWKTFFDGLDKKPEVLNTFFEIQDLLGMGDRNAVLERRRAGVRGMFDKGDMKASEIQKARLAEKEARRKNFLFKFKFDLIDKNYALIDRVNSLKKKGIKINDDENPVYYLEERNYLGGKVKSFMESNIQPVYQNLIDSDISWTDFGEALFYDRIRAGDRSDLANPRGITPKVAEELLNKMFDTMGETKARIMVAEIEKFRNALKTITEEAYNEGLYSTEMYEEMKKNPAYSTFQVLDHLEEGMTSKIHKSIGTLKDISNPADASLLKGISTFRAIERNKVTRSVVEFLEKNFPAEIKESDYVRTPKGKIPKESKLPNQDLVTYMKGGKRQGFYVDPYISKSINNETIGSTISILRVMNSNLFRPLFITYNPGFQAFNLIRDFKRFWKNTPNMSLARAIKLYRQAMPVAKARAWGIKDNNAWGAEILEKMEKEQILSITYNQLTDSADVEEQQIKTILADSGIDSFRPEQRNKYIKPFVDFLEAIKNVGDFIETLPKVAGYLELTEGGLKDISKGDKSFIRRKIGSPDFLAGGYWKPVTNEVFLFSNSITQGIRSDYETATDPKTRSGYWYKTAKSNILPKVLMYLASLGLFGAYLKEIMDKASEYDKTNYTIIPLSLAGDGKGIYFRDPQDEAGRLIGGLAWKMLNAPTNKQSIGKDFVDIANFTGGQLPSVSPSITATLATGQYLAGQNPYDWFRNREVLTDDQLKAGGMYSLKPFAGWLFGQSGGSIFYKFSVGTPKDTTGTEKFLNLPFMGNILGRFLKVSDYGTTEKMNEIKAEVQSDQAKRRIDEASIINDYIKKEQGLKTETAIDIVVKNTKAELVNEILGHPPTNEEELARAKNIEKKFKIGLQRGESDPYINALISSVTNDEKVALMAEYKKTLTKQDYNKILLSSLKYKIISPEVIIKLSNKEKNENKKNN